MAELRGQAHNRLIRLCLVGLPLDVYKVAWAVVGIWMVHGKCSAPLVWQPAGHPRVGSRVGSGFLSMATQRAHRVTSLSTEVYWALFGCRQAGMGYGGRSADGRAAAQKEDAERFRSEGNPSPARL